MESSALLSAINDRLSNEVKKLHKGNRGTCSIDECPNDSIAKNLCNAHYLRSKKNLDMNKPVQKPKKNCIECNKPTGNKGGWGRCANHYKMARQRAIKESLIDAMGGCCSMCQQMYPPEVYDFHHLGDKVEAPSNIIGNGSVEAIANELEKCVLLCANCHRITHARKL